MQATYTQSLALMSPVMIPEFIQSIFLPELVRGQFTTSKMERSEHPLLLLSTIGHHIKTSVPHVVVPKQYGREEGQPKPTFGRPAILSQRAVISHVHSIAPPALHIQSIELVTNITSPPQYGVEVADLACSLCMSIIEQPVQLTRCGYVVCASCLCTWLSVCPSSLPCPCSSNYPKPG